MIKSRERAVRTLVLAFLLAAFGSAAAIAQDAAPENNFQMADGLGVYLGVVPAQIVRGHAPSHPERTMHGGPGGGRHQYHLVVAIFEEPAGTRVTEAEVSALVEGEGHVGGSIIPLEPMTIDSAVSFGNFVALLGSDRYTIKVEVRRPGKAAAAVTFAYQHE
jgi:hypothetical protein